MEAITEIGYISDFEEKGTLRAFSQPREIP